MKPRSLRRVLGLQWALFAGALLVGLFMLALVALYVLEDSFIDARLREAERAFHGERPRLPQVELKRLDEIPASVRAQIEHLAARDYDPFAFHVRELRIDSDRYIHVRALPPDERGPRFLVFEAQDELRVTSAAVRAAPVLGLLLVLILLQAAWLARRFVRRIEGAAGSLLDAIEREPSVESLRAAADAQPVEEFQRFGQALAQSLEARLAALQREEETLRFIAHELRTPLQSARLAMEAMGEQIESAAEARLRRALQRLERASAAVLWLGESTPVAEALDVEPFLSMLVEEFAALAERRGQHIVIGGDADLRWALPPAAIEAVLGNLLINAIQHGAPGAIEISVDAERIEFRNAMHAEESHSGFGLGLELARRLLAKIGWTLEARFDRDGARLILAPVSRTPGV
ncbi:sensor histidine kinase [Aquimonas voraii]|uniref:histidine kinase n=1 Tax=Aquimonas voraii TaxID=265719 RepID=A0A1G6VQH0_9GAMM|nr:HAMP domain-containing sensor histidine kinase [Aquimonas voraii]SDD55900.1 Signal transduction histidine kinase [Aquimonas voraii]